MSQKNKDYSNLLKPEHIGKWIVLKADFSEILGYSNSVKVLKEKIGNKDVVYTKVLDPQVLYAL